MSSIEYLIIIRHVYELVALVECVVLLAPDQSVLVSFHSSDTYH